MGRMPEEGLQKLTRHEAESRADRTQHIGTAGGKRSSLVHGGICMPFCCKPSFSNQSSFMMCRMVEVILQPPCNFTTCCVRWPDDVLEKKKQNRSKQSPSPLFGTACHTGSRVDAADFTWLIAPSGPKATTSPGSSSKNEMSSGCVGDAVCPGLGEFEAAVASCELEPVGTIV